MGLENRLAAKAFAFILPWIDDDHPIVFMQDDGGKNPHAIPDFCFNFSGSTSGPIRIEFKVLNASNRVGLTRKQLDDWRQNSTYPDKPHCWIAVDREMSYFFWEQAAIGPLIEQVWPSDSGGWVQIPTSAAPHKEFLSVFRSLLQFAHQNQFCA
jgi:hypothetical protein